MGVESKLNGWDAGGWLVILNRTTPGAALGIPTGVDLAARSNDGIVEGPCMPVVEGRLKKENGGCCPTSSVPFCWLSPIERLNDELRAFANGFCWSKLLEGLPNKDLLSTLSFFVLSALFNPKSKFKFEKSNLIVSCAGFLWSCSGFGVDFKLLVAELGAGKLATLWLGLDCPKALLSNWKSRPPFLVSSVECFRASCELFGSLRAIVISSFFVCCCSLASLLTTFICTSDNGGTVTTGFGWCTILSCCSLADLRGDVRAGWEIFDWQFLKTSRNLSAISLFLKRAANVSAVGLSSLKSPAVYQMKVVSVPCFLSIFMSFVITWFAQIRNTWSRLIRILPCCILGLKRILNWPIPFSFHWPSANRYSLARSDSKVSSSSSLVFGFCFLVSSTTGSTWIWSPCVAPSSSWVTWSSKPPPPPLAVSFSTSLRGLMIPSTSVSLSSSSFSTVSANPEKNPLSKTGKTGAGENGSHDISGSSLGVRFPEPEVVSSFGTGSDDELSSVAPDTDVSKLVFKMDSLPDWFALMSAISRYQKRHKFAMKHFYQQLFSSVIFINRMINWKLTPWKSPMQSEARSQQCQRLHQLSRYPKPH